MTMEQLKMLVVAKYSLEELIQHRAIARIYSEEFSTQGLIVPEFLSNVEESLDSEIRVKSREEKLRRLQELKTQRESLRKPEERRRLVDQEIDELEASLK